MKRNCKSIAIALFGYFNYINFYKCFKIYLLKFTGGKAAYNSHFGVGETPVSYFYPTCHYYSSNFTNCVWKRLPFKAQCNNYQEAGAKCKGTPGNNKKLLALILNHI